MMAIQSPFYTKRTPPPDQATRDRMRAALDQRVAESKAKGYGPATFGNFEKELSKLNQQINESMKASEAQRHKKPKIKHHRNGDMIAQQGSSAFLFLAYSKAAGGVIASFANPTRGEWFYPMGRKDAKDWFNSDSLGGYFNDVIR